MKEGIQKSVKKIILINNINNDLVLRSLSAVVKRNNLLAYYYDYIFSFLLFFIGFLTFGFIIVGFIGATGLYESLFSEYVVSSVDNVLINTPNNLLIFTFSFLVISFVFIAYIGEKHIKQILSSLFKTNYYIEKKIGKLSRLLSNNYHIFFLNESNLYIYLKQKNPNIYLYDTSSVQELIKNYKVDFEFVDAELCSLMMNLIALSPAIYIDGSKRNKFKPENLAVKAERIDEVFNSFNIKFSHDKLEDLKNIHNIFFTYNNKLNKDYIEFKENNDTLSIDIVSRVDCGLVRFKIAEENSYLDLNNYLLSIKDIKALSPKQFSSDVVITTLCSVIYLRSQNLVSSESFTWFIFSIRNLQKFELFHFIEYLFQYESTVFDFINNASIDIYTYEGFDVKNQLSPTELKSLYVMVQSYVMLNKPFKAKRLFNLLFSSYIDFLDFKNLYLDILQRCFREDLKAKHIQKSNPIFNELLDFFDSFYSKALTDPSKVNQHSFQYLGWSGTRIVDYFIREDNVENIKKYLACTKDILTMHQEFLTSSQIELIDPNNLWHFHNNYANYHEKYALYEHQFSHDIDHRLDIVMHLKEAYKHYRESCKVYGADRKWYSGSLSNIAYLFNLSKTKFDISLIEELTDFEELKGNFNCNELLNVSIKIKKEIHDEDELTIVEDLQMNMANNKKGTT